MLWSTYYPNISSQVFTICYPAMWLSADFFVTWEGEGHLLGSQNQVIDWSWWAFLPKQKQS